jgi:hypothetical protein
LSKHNELFRSGLHHFPWLVNTRGAWNGHTWSIMKSPNPPGFQYHRLDGVSCPSTTSCYVVGFSQGSTIQALAEHWDGHTWSIMTNAIPAGTDYWDLSNVSCSNMVSCVAVGSFGGYADGKTFVEQWNGNTWSIVTSPNPASATSSRLTDVSCPTPTHCFAVGAFDRAGPPGPLGASSVEKTLVEQWNGQTWSIMTSPDPAQPGGYETLVLNGVSCHRTTSCFAVGEFASDNADGRATLIERYG